MTDARLTDRQRDLLRWLDDDQWKRPMDVGAWDGSHHSATLAALTRKGLAERKKLHAIYCPNGRTERINARGQIIDTGVPYAGCRCKGSCRYRRTFDGMRLSFWAELAGPPP